VQPHLLTKVLTGARRARSRQQRSLQFVNVEQAKRLNSVGRCYGLDEWILEARNLEIWESGKGYGNFP